jgi:hypothetical protein
MLGNPLVPVLHRVVLVGRLIRTPSSRPLATESGGIP